MGLVSSGSLGVDNSLWFNLLLPLCLQLCSLCQLLHNLPGIPHAACHVQDGLVANDIGEAVDLPEQLRF